MRIHYISASFLPSHYANSVHVMKMGQALAARGHAVSVFAHPFKKGNSPDIYKNYGVEKTFALKLIPRLSLPVLWNISYLRAVLKSIRSEPAPDLFYGRYVYALTACARAYPDVKVVLESHFLPTNPLQRAVERRLMQRPNFAGLVVISEALRQDYLKTFPCLKTGQVLAAHDGADLPAEGRVLPAVLQGEAGRLKIGYAGKLSEGKGLGLIGSLSVLCPKAEFHIFGGWPGEVEKWKTRIHGRNVFFYGHRPHSELAGFYPHMDILLAPLQQENKVGRTYDIGRWTSPLKIFEYMAHGKPVIASDIPPLREIIRNGKNGLLVDPQDPEAWKHAADLLIRDPALAEKLGRQGRKDLEERYAWSVRVRNVLEFAFRAGENQA
jgi:glycosyltransferase involved in cell wall biosynthesis